MTRGLAEAKEKFRAKMKVKTPGECDNLHAATWHEKISSRDHQMALLPTVFSFSVRVNQVTIVFLLHLFIFKHGLLILKSMYLNGLYILKTTSSGISLQIYKDSVWLLSDCQDSWRCSFQCHSRLIGCSVWELSKILFEIAKYSSLGCIGLVPKLWKK